MILFNKVGLAIKLVFTYVYNLIKWILNNTIGLIFNKSYTNFNDTNTNKESLWYKVRTVILLILLLTLILSFKLIYDNTFGVLIAYILKNIGLFINLLSNDNVFGLILVDYSNRFAGGIGVTLYLSLIGTSIGFIIALFFGFLQTLKINLYDTKLIIFVKNLTRRIIKTYVTIIRGTPMMVQAMILFWGVHSVYKWDFLTAGLVVVTINTAAYLTEVVRGGIESIDKGQLEGAVSLGLSNFEAMIHVIIPQAIKNIMASIGNEFVINIKDTSVLSVIMVVDLFKVATDAQNEFLDPFPPFIIAAVIYLVLTSTTTLILRKLEKRLDIPSQELPSAN